MVSGLKADRKAPRAQFQFDQLSWSRWASSNGTSIMARKIEEDKMPRVLNVLNTKVVTRLWGSSGNHISMLLQENRRHCSQVLEAIELEGYHYELLALWTRRDCKFASHLRFCRAKLDVDLTAK